MSIRLYIGNLPKEEVDRQDLQAVFAEAGESVSTKVIKDRKTGKCRGFGFVTVNSDEQADQIIEKFNGYMFKDTPLKIEKALPRAKGQEEEARPVTNASSDSGNTNVGHPEKATSNRRGGGNKKQRRPASNNTSSSGDSDGIKPDPRWASELEKLKQMLAAQTTNG